MKLFNGFCLVLLCCQSAVADDLNTEVSKARAEWNLKRKELDDVYVLYLEKLKVEQTKAGNLEPALELDQEIRRLRAESSAETEPRGRNTLIGKWEVTYDNGAKHHYTILSTGAVTYFDPQSKKTYQSKITYKPDGNWITFAHLPERPERLTLINGKLFVEHWDQLDVSKPVHALGTGLKK